MKKYALFTALFLCHFLSVHASIVNGFLQEKYLLENEMRDIRALLNEDNTEKATKQIERKLKKLQKEYEIVSRNYVNTEKLISDLKFIAPELFDQVSYVTNAEGTLTHVYVRYMNRTSEEFTYFTEKYFTGKAYTSVGQSKNNKNICTSFYGTNSITITIGIGCDELFALGHEFAHVLYIVPNLKEYAYFMKYRNKNANNISSHGHSPNDPSFTFIRFVEGEFETKYNNYINVTKMIDETQEYKISRKDSLP